MVLYMVSGTHYALSQQLHLDVLESPSLCCAHLVIVCEVPVYVIIKINGRQLQLCICLSAGKLGHGDTNRVYKPKVVDALQGMFIRKVCAGSQSSLALTSTGQV